jgi:hypothetical protein
MGALEQLSPEQSIKRSFRFREPLALTFEKTTASRAPLSLKFFLAPLALALTNEMSGSRFALVYKKMAALLTFIDLAYFPFIMKFGSYFYFV